MKQDLNSEPDVVMDDEAEEETVDTMSTDIVEDFARQLDQVVRIQSMSEDEDDNEEFGYQPLTQDEEDEDMYQQLQSDEEEEEVEQIKNPLDIDVDSSSRLNPETSDLIKSIMTNIQLSNDAIPDWAKKIPESAWLPRVNK